MQRGGCDVLYQLTDFGRSLCASVNIDPGPKPRESLEHRYWINKTTEHFEKKGYEITREHPIKGNGAIDILAEKPGSRTAIEVETGKSDIKANLSKVGDAGFDRVVLIATSPSAISACQKAIDDLSDEYNHSVELLTWLDIS